MLSSLKAETAVLYKIWCITYDYSGAGTHRNMKFPVVSFSHKLQHHRSAISSIMTPTVGMQLAKIVAASNKEDCGSYGGCEKRKGTFDILQLE